MRPPEPDPLRADVINGWPLNKPVNLNNTIDDMLSMLYLVVLHNWSDAVNLFGG